LVQGNVGRDEDWEIGVSLQTPEKVRKSQMALHAKAKGAPDYRFYPLCGKVYRADILEYAYRLCKASGSMGCEQKELVRLEAFWIDAWLRRNYDGIDSRYVVHDVQAWTTADGRISWYNATAGAG
jgi:uncharacterized sporulation protein YeaH/YhbH (DUF444 family)